MAEQPPTNANEPPAETEKPKTTSGSNSIFDDLVGWGQNCASDIACLAKWCARNPLGGVLVLTSFATLFYFYDCVRLFQGGGDSAIRWATSAWLGDQAYSWLVAPIAVCLVWYRRDALRAARKEPSWLGLFPILVAILLFIGSGRSLQPRLALLSLPFLVFGSALFFWGKEVARIIRFPAAFLFFLIPLGAMQQYTANLQIFATKSVAVLSHLCGIAVIASGTTLSGPSFNFEVAEGCSGIRSLIALVMITSVYVHLTQDKIWKKLLIFGSSVVFATVGNVARIFSIVLVGKFLDAKFAGGVYHEWSDIVMFFPASIVAMVLFGKVINLDLSSLIPTVGQSPQSREATPMEKRHRHGSHSSTPGSYDY